MPRTAADHARPLPGYRPPSGWDEAFDAHGRPRPAYEDVLDRLAGSDLEALVAETGAGVRALGCEFGGSPSSRAFVVDPVPRIVAAEEWAALERGLAQRATALAAFVADVYANARIVEAGVVPQRLLDSCRHFEPELVGVHQDTSACVAGLDLVRGDDGELAVLEDNFRTPSGIAYAAAARAAVDDALPGDAPADRLEPGDAYALLARALRGAAPVDSDARVLIVSDGPANSAWYEHREIARRTGFDIAFPADLSVRGSRLFARTGEGPPEPYDVVYRRTDEDSLTTADGKRSWLADAFLEPLRAGTVAVVNPIGSGVADDKLAHAYVPAMVRFYCGEEPLLASVHSHDLGDPEVRNELSPRYGELVLKPRSGLGGEGILLGPHASGEQVAAARDRIEGDASGWVAQEMVALSTHPTVRDGSLAPRHVDLRPFVVGRRAAPCALTRVALAEGEMIVNSSREGGGKDTWLMA